MEAACNLQILLQDQRGMVPLRRAKLRHEVWKLDLRWQTSRDIKITTWMADSINSRVNFQVDLKHIDQEKGSNVVDVGIDLKEFYLSVEWDILAVPATRQVFLLLCKKH